MVFQHPGLCLACKLTIFHEVNLSSFSTVCRWLPCVSAVWGSCPGSVPARGGMRQLVLLLTWAKLPLGCWQHPSHSLSCVLIIFYSQTYTRSSQQDVKAPSLSYREKRRLQLKSCLCAGISTGLAAYRTGKAVRSRQATPTFTLQTKASR